MAVTIDAIVILLKQMDKVKFKGFMTLYVEGEENKEEEKGMLPNLEENQEVKKVKLIQNKALQSHLQDTQRQV